MPLILHNHPYPAMIRGIKAVGVGKRGSRSLEPDLIADIVAELDRGVVPAIVQGAFFGALIIKGLTEDEKALVMPEQLDDPALLIDRIANEAPPRHIKTLCARLLWKDTLNKDEAEQLGDFLFSNQPGDGVRGLAASILRVRYETAEEYDGLLTAIEKTFEPTFQQEPPNGAPIVQLAEPFDGVDHSYLITPLVAAYLQSLDYRVISLVGRNSGPKCENNLLDVAQGLQGTFVKSSCEVTEAKQPFGYFLRQADYSTPLDKWVDYRRQIIKRPFLATLERFVNPVKADILIASAFHPAYGAKMQTIAQQAGFRAIVIIRNGMEGGLGFALKRPVKILCSVKHKDGSYQNHAFDVKPNEYLEEEVKVEEKLTHPSLDKNIELIKIYAAEGESGYRLFDLRVKLTCAGLDKALKWIDISCR